MKRKSSGQAKMFHEIWDETPKKERACLITGTDLNYLFGSSKWFSIFQHVLRKGYYTKWKSDKRNIVLLRPDVHTLIDQGTVGQRREFSKKTGHSFEHYFSLKERLKEEYEKENMPLWKKWKNK